MKITNKELKIIKEDIYTTLDSMQDGVHVIRNIDLLYLDADEFTMDKDEVLVRQTLLKKLEKKLPG